MIVPENSIALAKHFEGFYEKTYICPAGFWTIGWGHLCSKDHPRIDRGQGEIYLQEDLQEALRRVLQLCPVLLFVNDLELGAIVDFVFNLGSGRLQKSTLRRKINNEEWEDVPAELNKWVYGGGKKLKGLVLRRQAEAAYFA